MYVPDRDDLVALVAPIPTPSTRLHSAVPGEVYLPLLPPYVLRGRACLNRAEI